MEQTIDFNYLKNRKIVGVRNITKRIISNNLLVTIPIMFVQRYAIMCE